MSRFADVVLPLAVDKAFTYLIPPELEHAAAVGVRAVVPFGRTYAEGLIVKIAEETRVHGVKPLKDIIDGRPVMSGELLTVCRWVADYYLAPLGEVLRAAMPGGFGKPTKRMVRPGPGATEEAIALLERASPRRAQILALVRRHGDLSAAEIQKKVPLKTLNAALNEMQSAGYLEVHDVAAHRPGTQRMAAYLNARAVDPERLHNSLARLPKSRTGARKLLSAVATLLDSGVPEIAISDLLKSSGATSGSLRTFRDSGLLPVVKRARVERDDYGTEEQTLSITLNSHQADVLAALRPALDAGAHRTFLLHGVTGSGKTQVYIEAIRHCLSLRRTAIVLVPEISLTPQTVRRFNSHFPGRVEVLHSRMSAGERREGWRRALAGECSVVVGPRSAVFSPLANLGLIVVDEEQESSYKQFDAFPRYHARDVAVVRGSINGAVVILGSATPSLESYANARSGKYQLLEMPSRVDSVPMPRIAIVDMTAERHAAYSRLKESLPEEKRPALKEFQQSSVSRLLQEKIADRLSRREGIILLQNRRGFAPFVECPDCGYTVMCDNCSVTMIYHLAQRHLRCHYCGVVREMPDACPECGGRALKLVGIGTQRVEQELQSLFPEARTLRMDVDTTSRKGAHARLLQKFGEGKADILLGTQMVAKGLDFPRVTLVGVISADTQMLLPDFRSSERTFQLLTQVAGRAGRSVLNGEVVIQTHQPGHATLRHVIDHDFKSFFEDELSERRELQYPPFSRLVLIEARGTDENKTKEAAEYFARSLRRAGPEVITLGPAPAVISRVRSQYRWHVLAKNPKTVDPGGSTLRTTLRGSLESFQAMRRTGVQVTIDVDPAGLL